MIFTPKRPILSVVDGAARMGLHPNFISARTISKTYGIAVQKDINEFKLMYPDALIPQQRITSRSFWVDEQRTQLVKRQVINDVFCPFVRRQQLIKNSDQPKVYWVEPAHVTTDRISIRFYSSEDIDAPMFVEEGGEENRIEIELTEQCKMRGEPIPIIFVFCDTTIRVFVEVMSDNGQRETKEVALDFDTI